jgi:hypothetical protein
MNVCDATHTVYYILPFIAQRSLHAWNGRQIEKNAFDALGKAHEFVFITPALIIIIIIKLRRVRKADDLTAIYEPIV